MNKAMLSAYEYVDKANALHSILKALTAEQTAQESLPVIIIMK